MEEKTNIKPKLTDIIPLYGGINYIWRTTYSLDEKPAISNQIVRGAITLIQIAYNGFVGAEISNLVEGKPTLTSKILEKIV